MSTIFARNILRLHTAKIGAGNVIRKRFMTFPITWSINEIGEIDFGKQSDYTTGKLIGISLRSIKYFSSIFAATLRVGREKSRGCSIGDNSQKQITEIKQSVYLLGRLTDAETNTYNWKLRRKNL